MEAIRKQIQVIAALMLREVRTRFGRLQLGYLWLFLEPLLFVGVFALLFYFIDRPFPAGMPLLLFLATGVVPFMLFRDCMMRSLSAIPSNRQLLTFPQVTPLDLVVGRALLEAATKVIVFIVMVAVGLFLSDTARIENVLLVGFYLLCFALLGFNLGAWLAAFSILFPAIERFTPHFLVRPAFWTSGLFFTADMLPEVAREYGLINPLLHGTELLRSAFFVEFESNYGDVGYLLMWVFSGLFLGLVAQRAMRKRILIAAQS